MNDNNDSFEVKHCICCWYDFLGFGAPFIEANWDLNNVIAHRSLKRIQDMDYVLLSGFSLVPPATKLYINDGIISSIDVELTNNDSLYKSLIFIEALLQDYDMHNSFDKRNGYPGIRGVITCGQRFSYDTANTTVDAASNCTVAYYPKEFQMNTAFSKAYIIENSGSKAGLSGPHMYIDISIFKMLNQGFRNQQCHKIETIENDSERIVTITFNSHWFVDLIFDLNAIQYVNKGINTELYRLTNLRSSIDEYAKEVERIRNARWYKTEE